MASKVHPVYGNSSWIDRRDGRLVRVHEVIDVTKRRGDKKVVYGYYEQAPFSDRMMHLRDFRKHFQYPGSSPFFDKEQRRWVARNYGDPIPEPGLVDRLKKNTVASAHSVRLRLIEEADCA